MHRHILPLAAALALTVAAILSARADEAQTKAKAGSDHEHVRMEMAAAGAAVSAGDLTIGSAWARAMLPGQPAGSAFLSVTNKGSAADRFVSISSPAAGKVEIHSMKMENDVMTMRPVEGGLEIPAGETVELSPDAGFHLMFTDVKEPFKKGATVPVTLEFEKAGKVELTLPVLAANAKGIDHSHHGAMK